MNMKQTIDISNIPIAPYTHEEVTTWTRAVLQQDLMHRIATVNAEFVMEAQINTRFREVLNISELNVADGSGILWAAKYLSLPKHGVVGSVWQMVYSGASLILWPSYCKTVIPERVTGVDLMTQLCGLAESEKKKVLLIGGLPGVWERTIAKLNARYPELVVEAVGDDLKFVKNNGVWSYDESLNRKILEKVKLFEPSMIFVAYGHPKQEFWIDDHKNLIPSVRIAMGVGGSFDFIAGDIKRAPRIFRKLGVEWLWRLMRQPQRFSRIFTATVKFVSTIINSKLQKQ